ncbi:sulfite exporter TauE/SafE family protein [soil metagenome]
MIWLTVILLGIAVGLVMGLTGAGGGIVGVPALVFVLGWSMQAAMPVALLAVTVAAAIGAAAGLRKKLVRYRAAMLMAVVGAPFTMLGVMLAKVTAQRWLMLGFALILFSVAIRLIMQLRHLASGRQDHQARVLVNQDTGRFQWTWGTGVVIGSIGSVAGLMTGLLGVGGGFVIVPLLQRFTNVSLQAVMATSLLTIALVGSAGVASALAGGAQLPVVFSAVFMSATILGMLAGRRLAGNLSVTTVQALFAILLLLVAGSLIFRALVAA